MEELINYYQYLDHHVPVNLDKQFIELSSKSAETQNKILSENRNVNTYYYIIRYLNGYFDKRKRKEMLISSFIDVQRLDSILEKGTAPYYTQLKNLLKTCSNDMLRTISIMKNKAHFRDLAWKGIPQIFAYFAFDAYLHEAQLFYTKALKLFKPKKFIGFSAPYFVCCSVAPFCEAVFKEFLWNPLPLKSSYKAHCIKIVQLCNHHLPKLSLHHNNLIIEAIHNWSCSQVWELIIHNLILQHISLYISSNEFSDIKIDRLCQELAEFSDYSTYIQKMNIQVSQISVPDTFVIGKYAIPLYHIVSIDGLLSILELDMSFPSVFSEWKDYLKKTKSSLRNIPLKTEFYMPPLLQPEKPSLFFSERKLDSFKVDDRIVKLWNYYSSIFMFHEPKMTILESESSNESDSDDLIEYVNSIENNIPLRNSSSNFADPEELDEDLSQILLSSCPDFEPFICTPNTQMSKARGLENRVILKTFNNTFDSYIMNIDRAEFIRYGLWRSIKELELNGIAFEQYLDQKNNLNIALEWIVMFEDYSYRVCQLLAKNQKERYLGQSTKQILNSFDKIIGNFTVCSKAKRAFAFSLVDMVEIKILESFRILPKFQNKLNKIVEKQKKKFYSYPKRFERYISRYQCIVKKVNHSTSFELRMKFIFDVMRLINAVKHNLKEKKYAAKTSYHLFKELIIIKSRKWILGFIYIIAVFIQKLKLKECIFNDHELSLIRMLKTYFVRYMQKYPELQICYVEALTKAEI